MSQQQSMNDEATDHRVTLDGSARQWWRNAVGYQIYPKSFSDSDGDGVGDLRGIINRLDYLKWLGVDFIWLSPVYASPQCDNGYDICDYQAIDPTYGTMADFDELLDQAHARGIRLVMDLVVNHTSDQHPWFIESRSSTDNSKRDWYWWRDHPNNWESRFSGSAWEHDQASGQYYLHLFAKQQPDLNWENPDMRQAVYAMMRWWLDKGIDGFRMDVINLISKDPALPDGEPIAGTAFGNGRPFYTNGPRLHEFLQEMRRDVFDGRDRALVTIGETPQASVHDGQLFTDPARRELDMVFQFEHVNVDYGEGRWDPIPLSLPKLKASLERWQAGLAKRGWNSLYFNNHDQPRVASRWGDPLHLAQSAKAWATVLHLHRGTPFVYQGEELGMTNYEVRGIDDLIDIQSRNYYFSAVEAGDDPDEVLARVRLRARDHARTPMQWSADPNAGFSRGTPWMPVNPNYCEINVDHEASRDDSVLSWYRKLIELRHSNEVVALGDCEILDLDDPQLYVIRRRLGDRTVWMIANLSGSTRSVGDRFPVGARLLLDTHAGQGQPSVDHTGLIEGWQAVVVESVGAADPPRARRSQSPDHGPRPKIAVTLGDPAGIGPELIVRLLATTDAARRAQIVLLASRDMVEAAEATTGLRVPLASQPRPGAVVLDDDEHEEPAIPVAVSSAQAGAHALRQLGRALDLVARHQADGIMFGPLNKASLHAAGMIEHDELRWFAKRLGHTGTTSEINISPTLWTSRVTSHVPIKEVSRLITVQGVVAASQLLHDLLQRSGVASPRLAVCALNPHAGDNGNFGDEEITIIRPAVEQAARSGLQISGPWPCDTVFLAARRGDYDGVVTMYHDQGQIAMKLMGFNGGVTLEGGLPIPIATPAHGTAFDLVGRGVADLTSTVNAFNVVVALAAQPLVGDQDGVDDD